MSSRKIYILLLLLFCTSALGAQNYVARIIDSKLGLSNNNVVSIAQDKKGFIWVATEDGLNIFDGNRFRTVEKGLPAKSSRLVERQGSIVSNELSCLLDDPTDSLLWIGTPRDGISCLDYVSGKFTSYVNDKGNSSSLVTNDVTSLTAARDGKIWITTYWGGLDKLDKSTGRFTHINQKTFSGLVSSQMWTMAEAKDGTLYVGHVWDGISIINPKTKKVKNIRWPQLPANEVHSLCIDHSGLLWIGTGEGLATYNPKTQSVTDVTSLYADALKGHVTCVREVNGEIWATTDKSVIVRIRDGKADVMPIGDYTYMNSNLRVRNVFVDSFGNAWIGIIEGGLAFVQKEAPLYNNIVYSPYEKNLTSLLSKGADGICFDKEGRMYVGSHGEGVTVFKDGRRIESYNTRNGKLQCNNIVSLFHDSNGTVWCGGIAGNLFRLNRSTDHFTPVFQDNEVRFIREDRKGKLWVGTTTGAHVFDEKTSEIEATYKGDVLWTWSAQADNKGRVWVGTFGGGVYVMKDNGKLIRQLCVADKSLPSNSVYDILNDSRGNIWLATPCGIVRYEKGDIKRSKVYDTSSGMLSQNVHSLVEDNLGNIWFATNKGIGAINRKGEVVWASGSNDNDPANAGACFHDGKVYFTTSGGVLSFSPRKVLDEHKSAKAIISDLSVRGNMNEGDDNTDYPVNVNGEIELEHYQNSLTFTVTCPNYSEHDITDFSYRLIGYDENWYPVAKDNVIAFRNLPYGKYHLEIRSRLLGGKWGEVTTKNFVINPPLWLTWWMKCIYIIILIMVVSLVLWFWQQKLYFQSRMASVQIDLESQLKANQEQLDFYKNISKGLQQLREQRAQTDRSTDNEFIEKVTKLIESNLDSSQMDVNYLASELGMSNSTLYRKMKNVLGISALDFIKDVKMKHARDLLLSGKYSISEVGYMLGYNSPASFRQAFKEKYGKTPSEFLQIVEEE